MNQSNQQGRRRRFLTLALGLPLALFTLVATPTLAAKRIHVDCAHGAALQAAIDAAASGSTLHVKGTCTGQFTISKDLVLEGHGKRATLDGGNAGPVLTIQEGSTVQVVRLTITHGDTAFDGGGGILNFGTLTLTDSTVTGNTAFDGGGIFNSGIGTFGIVTLTDSTVSGNTAFADGGGILNTGTLTLTDSTVTGNTALADGGGIRNVALGSVTLTDSTVTGNTPNDCTGIVC